MESPLIAAPEFLSQNVELSAYHTLLQQNIGTFTKHFCGSVPLSFEERCRMGLALCKWAKHRAENGHDFFAYYETSSTDGTDARTMAEYSGGLIRTLTDSPNPANQRNFYQLSRHDFSRFHLGSFVDITPEFLASQPGLHHFKDGFDAIHENATLQFYGPEREEQIAYLIRVLKTDGIMIFHEKLNHPNRSEYERREQVKDKYHKSKYFSDKAIAWKRSNMLEEMERGQVDMEALVQAIKKHFKYACITWNSTNFYKVVCSNNYESIHQFVTWLCFVTESR